MRLAFVIESLYLLFSVILVIIAVLETAQGKNNKLLKKIYKALKMPQDSTYLKDIEYIAANKVMMQF